MTDLLDELLEEAPEGEDLPSSPGAVGEKVDAGVPSPVPLARPFSPPPHATLARRTVGKALVTKDNLKRLSQRHKLLIGLHLNGKSHAEIATIIGCSRMRVVRVLQDPLAQEVIKYYYEGVEEELKALFPKVVDVVRDALHSPLMETKLKGVDRFAKLTGAGEKGEDQKGVTINIINDARKKFVQELRENEERTALIDVEPSE